MLETAHVSFTEFRQQVQGTRIASSSKIRFANDDNIQHVAHFFQTDLKELEFVIDVESVYQTTWLLPGFDISAIVNFLASDPDRLGDSAIPAEIARQTGAS